ncbi:4118_t:CDS:2 [Funneliformis geosporum]|uniref:14080_t:CDS:1 n=1 Tax=Funneliformis geosporum TaxID=1117311 RepID=A0A9W4WMN1_9GLOM|nr:4118_t:CDS:2 [Funneliformis geosporum]CAI2173304.1 14080_t:CDS:2 [Funneliformis geosporum]
MTEHTLTISTNVNNLSRLPRNGKNKNYSSSLTEENLKLHTGMMPTSRETKTHFVLVYVDLQKKLIALEAQLRKEAQEAQERFSASLPDNTPSVIPEVIHVPSLSNSRSNTIKDKEYTSPLPTNDIIYSIEPEYGSSRPIETIPKLLDSVIDHRRKDVTSLRAEPSIPPSPSQSTVRSRNSSHRRAPFIHLSKPVANRTNSADTMHTISVNQTPSSSLNNNVYNSSPSLPPTPNTTTHFNMEKRHELSSIINTSTPPSPGNEHNEKCENDACKIHRDSGISLVSPVKPGHHSREHSISSILRKMGSRHAFQKEQHHQFDGHRKERGWAPFSPKDNDTELLAFRYPSIYNNDIYIHRDSSGMDEQDNSSSSGYALISEFDGCSGKQKERERSVTFDLDDQQVLTLDEETGLNKRKRCSGLDSTMIPHIDLSDLNVLPLMDFK